MFVKCLVLLFVVGSVLSQASRTDFYGFRNTRGNIFQQHGSQLSSSDVLRNVYAPYGHAPTLNGSQAKIFKGYIISDLSQRLPSSNVSKRKQGALSGHELKAVLGLN